MARASASKPGRLAGATILRGRHRARHRPTPCTHQPGWSAKKLSISNENSRRSPASWSADAADSGGGIWIYARPDTTAVVTLNHTEVEDNDAVGGHHGTSGSDGKGQGGGVYNFHATFARDAFSPVTDNDASTNGDDIFNAP